MKNLPTYESFVNEGISKGAKAMHKVTKDLLGTIESTPMKWKDLESKFRGIDMPEPDSYEKSELTKPVWIAVKGKDGSLFGVYQEEIMTK